MKNTLKNKILIISGATASGKSALAQKIALAKNGAIINADSIQLYSELPILSAQPTSKEQGQVSHFLYSILKHNENSSLARWLELATNIIDKTLENNQLPIVVGGTGLYLSKLIDGINQIPEIEENLKNQIRQICQNFDKRELIKLLTDLKDDNKIIEKLDKQRLARRLEVLKQTGKTLSWWQNQPKKTFYPKENFIHLNIDLPRNLLYQNCDKRLGEMFKNGALQEVENLIKSSKTPVCGGITKTIGFAEIKNYLEGKISQEEATKSAAQKTRNYAKRQLTWFRNQFDNKIIIEDIFNDKVFDLII
jgi:tRNA dimethylallyltransferase